MLNILEREQLEYQPMTLKQRWRIKKQEGRTDKRRKRFAVFVGDDLYLVQDEENLDRLFYERLKADSIYKANIYPIS